MFNIKDTSFFVGMMCVAGFLLFLAVPRFFSSMNVLYSDIVIKQISIGTQDLSKSDYLAAQEHVLSALEWTDAGIYWQQLSLLKHSQFISGIAANNNVDQSIAELKATTEIALTLLPVAPYTWYDMALIDAMYPETLENALNAIKMSIYVDRVNQNLLKSRVLFLWNNIDDLDGELMSLFNSQLLLLWQVRRSNFKWLLARHPKIEPFISKLLLNSPEELLEFNKLISR